MSSSNPALAPPETAAVAPYDFAAPRRLAQAQLRVLDAAHRQFAQTHALVLSTQLRTLVDITVGAHELVPYADWVAGTPAPAALYVAPTPNGRHVALDLDVRMAAFLVERLVGGEGVLPAAARALSPVEQQLVGKLATAAFVDLVAAWARAAELSLGAPRYEGAAEFAHVGPSSEQVLVVPFTIHVQHVEAELRLVYPLPLVERLLDRPALLRWSTGGEMPVPTNVRTGYEARLATLPVELRAELGRTRLRLAELDALAEGDVIPLGQKVSAPLAVTVRGREAFRAAAGRSGDRLALQILNVAETPLTP